MQSGRLFTFFYDCSLALLSLAMLPKVLYMRFFHDKYQNGFSQRLGYQFPTIEKNGRKLIWIHAVSVGETRAVTPLAKRIKEENPKALLLVTSVTETGHAEAKRALPFADFHLIFPFDFSWTIRSVLAKAMPDLVIVCESDFWYNFLSQCKRGGARIVLVNGKLSERSFRRYQFFRGLGQRLFSLFDLLCLQNDTYKERFMGLGIAPERLAVTGNTKFDDRGGLMPQEQLDGWMKKLGIKGDDRVLVIGSTHHPEEKNMARFIPGLLTRYPDLKILIVPRHPERFNSVADILRAEGISFQRYSEGGDLTARVILVDAMGLLRNCYQIAFLAIVGGSFVDHVGGHNILEPLWYNVPVIYGPYMYSQADLVDLVGTGGAGIQVSADRLEATICKFYDDSEYRSRVAGLGKVLVDSVQGSTERTFKIIRPLL